MNKELIIKYCNIDNAFTILNYLKKAGIKLDICVKNNLEDVLISSTPEIVSFVLRQVIGQRITNEFVENHLEILISKEKYEEYLKQGIQLMPALYDTFVENINIIKSQRVDLSSNSYNPKILLSDTTTFKQTHVLMQKYKLTDISLLGNGKLFELIDLLIEQGVDVQKIDFSNVGDNDINLICKRIIIANSIDYPIINESKINKDILTGENFIISDDKLDDFIIDDTIESSDAKTIELLDNENRLTINPLVYELNIIIQLDQNYQNYEENFVFDKIIISRNKVLRNLSTLINIGIDPNQLILDAIIYKGFLSSENIETIKKYLDPIVLKKDVN